MGKVFDDIKIDDEFAALIPPLSAEERQQLEENIVEHGGARDPLVVWASKGKLTLLDGHNRYEICTRLDLPFDIKEMRFSDRSHAEEWIIRNQFGRRNLSAYVRTQLALRLEETIAARSRQGERTDLSAKSPKGDDGLDTREEIARLAGVGSNTVSNVKKIDAAEKAGKVDAETVAKLRTGEVSINQSCATSRNRKRLPSGRSRRPRLLPSGSTLTACTSATSARSATRSQMRRLTSSSPTRHTTVRRSSCTTAWASLRPACFGQAEALWHT